MPKPAPAENAVAEVPAVPLTVEGYSVLHQMMRFRWTAWRSLSKDQRSKLVNEAVPVISAMESNAHGQSALYSLIGHKGLISSVSTMVRTLS